MKNTPISRGVQKEKHYHNHKTKYKQLLNIKFFDIENHDIYINHFNPALINSVLALNNSGYQFFKCYLIKLIALI